MDELNKRVEAYFKSEEEESKYFAGYIYWEDIINLIEENEFDKLNSFFRDFNNILKSWFLPSEIKFTMDELTATYSSQTPKIIIKLFEIVDQVGDEIGKKGYKVSRAKNSTEYGINVHDSDGDYLFFFGLWYEVWEEASAPLCLALLKSKTSKNIQEAFIKQFPEYQTYNSNWKYSTFDKHIFKDEKVVERIVDTIDKLLIK